MVYTCTWTIEYIDSNKKVIGRTTISRMAVPYVSKEIKLSFNGEEEAKYIILEVTGGRGNAYTVTVSLPDSNRAVHQEFRLPNSVSASRHGI